MSTKPGICVEIPAGELIDKITILEIKAARITDAEKLGNVRRELQVLCQARDAAVRGSAELDALTRQLKSVNQVLWQVEDAIRDCERNQDFGPKFIELARRVYQTNDRRADLKRQINQLLGSRLVEEKFYTAY
jgi:hypothetical protein